MTEPPAPTRRPLKSRNHRLAAKTAAWLSRHTITPNQISLTSVLFALVGAALLVSWHGATGQWQWLLPLLSVACIQGRLLCNLFDGMVAMEGGKATPAGELFNDIPDRVADCLLIVAAGYVASLWWSPAFVLGWLGALFAVTTAYVRILGASLGAPMRFLGPMAKQHRMATLTLACLASCLEPWLWSKGVALTLATLIIVIGSAWTVVRRTQAIYRHLEDHARA